MLTSRFVFDRVIVSKVESENDAAHAEPQGEVDSEAHAMGLMPGDEIVLMNGYRAAGRTLGWLQNILGGELSLTLQVRRGGGPNPEAAEPQGEVDSEAELQTSPAELDAARVGHPLPLLTPNASHTHAPDLWAVAAVRTVPGMSDGSISLSFNPSELPATAKLHSAETTGVAVFRRSIR